MFCFSCGANLSFDGKYPKTGIMRFFGKHENYCAITVIEYDQQKQQITYHIGLKSRK